MKQILLLCALISVSMAMYIERNKAYRGRRMIRPNSVLPNIHRPAEGDRHCTDDVADLIKEIDAYKDRTDDLKEELCIVLGVDADPGVEVTVEQAAVDKIMERIDANICKIREKECLLEQVNATCCELLDEIHAIKEKWADYKIAHQQEGTVQDMLDAHAPGDRSSSEEGTSLEIGEYKKRYRIKQAKRNGSLQRRDACAAVPKTNTFISEVQTMISKSEADRQCIERVGETAESVKQNIEDFHTTTELVGDLKDFLSTLTNTLTVLSNLPYIGSACSGFNKLVSQVKKPISTAYTNMQKIDKKFYDEWSDRAELVEEACANASKALTIVENRGKDVVRIGTSSRDCICDMPTDQRGPFKDTAETTSGGLTHIPTTMNTALGRVSTTCKEYDALFDKLVVAMPTKIIKKVYKLMDDFISFLGPVYDIFTELSRALNKKMCLPNPAEISKEVAEDTAEVAKELGKEAKESGKEVKEKAEEVKEKIKKKAKSWRRKRDIFMTKTDAADVIGARGSRVARASNICFTVQEIIDGLNSAFKEFTKWAQKLLDEILKQIPGLDSLTDFLPDFDFDFNLLGKINWPSVNFMDFKFNWNVDKYFAFVNFDLDLLKFDNVCSVDVRKKSLKKDGLIRRLNQKLRI